MIYLDNAATTLQKPEVVRRAVYDSFDYVGNSLRGSHQASMRSTRMVNDTRKKIAQLFHCKADEVAFTKNATEALNIAIRGTLHSGNHVITTPLEHNSVIRPLHLLDSKYFSASFIHVDPDGKLNYDSLTNALNLNSKALISTHASNVTGQIIDLETLGEFCERNNLIFIVDAAQTAGVYPIDMEKMKIDILCFTGHKGLLGPQGTGGICIKENIKVDPLIVGGSGIDSYNKEQPREMPYLLEAGTINTHGIIGLHAALDYILEKTVEQIYKEEMILHDLFISEIKDIPGLIIYGHLQSAKVAIVALNIEGLDSSLVSSMLMEKGIATRAGAHCAPFTHRVLGTEKTGAVRFSFSHMNTAEEAHMAANALREIATQV